MCRFCFNEVPDGYREFNCPVCGCALFEAPEGRQGIRWKKRKAKAVPVAVAA
jgi:hypothetical protein